MTVRWWWVALAALAVVVGLQHRAARRAHDGRVAAEAERRLARREADSLRGIVRVREVVRIEARTEWDTLRLTDTLYRVSRETLVVRAERAITTCERALSACQAQVGALERVDTAGVRALRLQRRELSGCKALLFLPCIQPEVEGGATYPFDRVRGSVGVAVGDRFKGWAKLEGELPVRPGGAPGTARIWVGGRWTP